MRCISLIVIQHLGDRAAIGEGAQRISFVEPAIDKHGYVICLLSCLGHSIQIESKMMCHEMHLRLWCISILGPFGALGIEFHHLWRVVDVQECSRLILHLYGYDAPRVVIFTNVLHEGREGFGIGQECFLAEWRDGGGKVTVCLPGPEESLGILFGPKGHVGRLTVFPCCKPQDDDTHLMFFCQVYHAVCECEVKLAFFRLKLFPGDRCQHGIQSHSLHRDDVLGEHIVGGCTGVSGFTCYQQRRFPIHEQAFDTSILSHVTYRVVLLLLGANGLSYHHCPTNP